LPYYGTEKSTEEIHQILTDAHLNPDQDLLELEDDLLDYYNNEIVISKEVDIDNVLNLDAFVDTLGDIIEDSIDSIEEEIQNNDKVDVPMNENDENDPAAKADEL
jgi:flagellar biosynthesis chaperone FliJ